jgi:CBS domain-containing protein
VLQSAVWAITRRRSVGVTAAAWGGRIAAVALMAVPIVVLPARGYEVTVIDFVLTFMIAAFLWTGAGQALKVTKIRSRLPALQARALARPAIGVPADLPLAEAVRRAQEARAGSLVVLTADGRPTGVVSEDAVRSTPEERRPWLPVGDLARRIEPGLYVGVDLGGEALVKVLNATPASEYVVVHPDGSIYGVLVSKDVDTAFKNA